MAVLKDDPCALNDAASDESLGDRPLTLAQGNRLNHLRTCEKGKKKDQVAQRHPEVSGTLALP